MAEEYLSNEQELLKSHLHGMVKQYVVLDGQGRVSKSYVAPRGARVGDPAMVTEYVYPNLTSTLIIARKEAPSKWDELNEGWDSNFTV